MTAVREEPVRGVFGHPAITRLSGVDAMRLYLARRLPAPPIHHLTGLLPTDGGLTHATFALPVTRWLLDGTGFLMPSAAALVSDAPLGLAFTNSLPAGKVSTTSELSISYLRPAGLEAERLIAHADVIKAGASTGLTQARITDANGRLLAHATSRLVVLDVPVDEQTPLPQPTPQFNTPDPYQREAPGENFDWKELSEASGKELFERWLSGELSAPPIHHLTGLRPTGLDGDRVCWSLPTSAWLCSPAPFLFGGAIALLADSALRTAVMPTLPPRMTFGPLDLKMRFLRPIFPNTGDLVATAGVVHQGRSVAITRGEIRTADGKLAVLAESSLLLRPVTGS